MNCDLLSWSAFVLYFLSCSVLVSPAVVDSSPIVQTKLGGVRGTLEHTLLDNREYNAFRGIPYGKAPIGVLRFKAPVGIEAWSGIWNGTAFGSPCAQPTMYMTSYYGSEDCLTLNVFTPDITPDAGLPVIIYIHGGAFLMGSGRGMGADILLNEHIVLVTINYRLGPFGFLNLDSADGYSGNMGLKDQLLALKWVRNNIRAFGGDPELVTLYGHSAGAVAIHMHILSATSRPYFKRAIMSGASAYVPWAYGHVNHSQMMAEMISKATGVATDTIHMSDIVEWLRNVDMNSFGMETLRPFFIGGHQRKKIDFTWMPVVEDDGCLDPFFTKSVYEYAQERNDVDTMFSFTDAESLLLDGVDLNAPHTLKAFDEHFELQLPLVDLLYNTSSVEYQSYAKEIRQFYFGNKSIDRNTLREYVKLLSDSFFIYGIQRAVETQAEKSSGKTFLFKFAGDLKLNFFRKFANGSALDIPGATHTEEMCYVFRLSEMENLIDETEYNRLTNDGPEGKMAKTLIKFIANFAQYGNPTPQKIPIDFRSIENASIMNYLSLTNDGLEINTQPRQDSIQFWNDFFQKHGSKLNLH